MWELDYKESWALKNWWFWSVVLEKTLESPLDCKKIQLVNPKGNLSWIFIGRTDAEAETPILWPPDVKNWIHWKRHWCWERLKAGREGDHRGWDDWMASLTWWTWVWVSSRSRWWTGKPGMLQSMGSQRVRHDWATELNLTDEAQGPLEVVYSSILDVVGSKQFLSCLLSLSLFKKSCPLLFPPVLITWPLMICLWKSHWADTTLKISLEPHLSLA